LPGILLLILGIAVAAVGAMTLTKPLPLPTVTCDYRRYGGCEPLPVDLVLSIVGVVTLFFGAIILYGEIASLRKVEWKKEVQTQETEVN
jgi:hypothetical protein